MEAAMTDKTAINRGSGGRRRRPGRADRGDCAGRGRHRDRADRAAPGRPTTAPPRCWRVRSPRSRRSASGPAARRRPRRCGSCGSSTTPARLIRAPEVQLRRGRDRARRVRPQYREPASGRRARSARARACLAHADRGRSATRSRPATIGVDRRARRAAATVARAARRSAPTAGARSAAPPPASRPTAASYPQTALTFNLRHARPHHDISTEFHTESGPFTLVPLPGERSSLVCVRRPGRGRRSSRRSTTRRSTTRSSGARIRSSARSRSSRAAACFRSRSRPRARFAANRIALVGEAAHLIPPIGAQGLNLGLRDAATIGELVVAARRDGGDIGAPICWRATTRMRRADVEQPHARGRSAQPHAAVRFPAGAGRARARPLSARPDRPAAPRGDARGRRAGALSQPRLMRGEAL